MAAIRKTVAQTSRHMTVAEQEEKKFAENLISNVSTDEIIRPPSWLNKVAKKEWNRIVPQLLQIDIVGNLDLANVAGYCNAFAVYKEATENLNKGSLVIETEDEKTGAIFIKENPYLKAQTTAAVEMRKFADLCGMTISSRLKAADTKLKVASNTIEEKFGDI